MPRAVPINDRLASWRQIRLLARYLIACGARQASAAAVTGVGVALVAPRLIPMILAYPASATAELAFHAALILVDSPSFVRTLSLWGTAGVASPAAGGWDPC